MDRHEYFRHFHDIDAANYHLLVDTLKVKTFKKGDFITVPGQIQKELYFVKSGVQMSHFEADFLNSSTIKLETCGHFPQEEQADEVWKAISDFVG